MEKIGTRVKRFLTSRFPKLYYQVVRRPQLAFQFSIEKKLAKGARLSQSAHPSILFFTTQKCASRYVDDLIAQLSAAEGMLHADYDAYVAMIRVPRERNPFTGTLDIAFNPHGYYYGPIGTFREIPQSQSYKVLLQLRDPRDVLTSLYFSTAFSHALISPKLIRRREEALKMDLDEFVVQGAEEYVRIYQTYCERMLKKPGVLFVKYEDMVGDFEKWLRLVAGHLGFSGQDQLLDRLVAQANFSVEVEDKFSQRRQIAPGEHKRKLRKETVNQINQVFGSILKDLDYKL